MADQHLLRFLFNALHEKSGRIKWHAEKAKARLVDLSSADFTELDLRDYDFSEALLTTAIFLGADVGGADFSDAELSYADLRRAHLGNCCFDRADLRSVNLQGAILTDANLEETNLSGARMAGADLVGADLSNADLTGADLRGASLKYARLTGAHLEDADVAEADLTGSVLDDDAPAMLKNFDLALVDDRKYRVMRSRLSHMKSNELILPDQAEAPAAPEEKPKRRRRKLRIKLTGKDKWPKIIQQDSGGGAGDVYLGTPDDLESVEGCYRILGIDSSMPLAAITKAYRQRVKLYHPDKTRHLAEEKQAIHTEQFHLVRGAYESLSRKMAKPLTHVKWPDGMAKRESSYDYTLDEYMALAEANPTHADVLYNLAWKYFEAAMLEEAMETYERVLSINREDRDAEFNLRVVKICKVFDVPSELAIEGS